MKQGKNLFCIKNMLPACKTRNNRDASSCTHSSAHLHWLWLCLCTAGWIFNYFQLATTGCKRWEILKSLSAISNRAVRLQRQQLLSQYAQYAAISAVFRHECGRPITTNSIQPWMHSVTVGQAVLDQMVNEELIRQESAKRGISVSEDELNENHPGRFWLLSKWHPTPSAT